jgi:hypothetical protein
LELETALDGMVGVDILAEGFEVTSPEDSNPRPDGFCGPGADFPLAPVAEFPTDCISFSMSSTADDSCSVSLWPSGVLPLILGFEGSSSSPLFGPVLIPKREFHVSAIIGLFSFFCVLKNSPFVSCHDLFGRSKCDFL